MYKVSQNFNQREVTQKVRKGEQLFLHPTCRLDLIYIAIKFHQDVSYGNKVNKESLKKPNQREVTQKLRKGEQPFLYTTQSLNLIPIALKFHQDILYSYLLMVPIR